MIRELLADGANAGDFRSDVPPDELATYCLHALTAASSLPSKAAVRRLVTVTLAALRDESTGGEALSGRHASRSRAP